MLILGNIAAESSEELTKPNLLKHIYEIFGRPLVSLKLLHISAWVIANIAKDNINFNKVNH